MKSLEELKKTYDQDRTVCGLLLPEGLVEASRIPEGTGNVSLSISGCAL